MAFHTLFFSHFHVLHFQRFRFSMQWPRNCAETARSLSAVTATEHNRLAIVYSAICLLKLTSYVTLYKLHWYVCRERTAGENTQHVSVTVVQCAWQPTLLSGPRQCYRIISTLVRIQSSIARRITPSRWPRTSCSLSECSAVTKHRTWTRLTVDSRGGGSDNCMSDVCGIRLEPRCWRSMAACILLWSPRTRLTVSAPVSGSSSGPTPRRI